MVVIVDPVYPGNVLREGSSSSEVARMQKYLNAIKSMKYPQMGTLTVDGKFGSATKKVVEQYQAYSGLKIDGSIGQNTWNSIVSDYNTLVGGSADTYPGIPLRQGSNSSDVAHMQRQLNSIVPPYTAINKQTVDGDYGTNMVNAVKRFQRLFSLSIDGVIGQNTWAKIISVKNAKLAGTPTKVTAAYNGVVLTIGSEGDSVRCVQSFLNATSNVDTLTIDGKYGTSTKNAVVAFQAYNRLSPDGMVGSATWAALVQAFNASI